MRAAGRARRHLREETGYEAGEVAAIEEVAPNRRFRIIAVIALSRGPYPAGLQDLDANTSEDIEVVEAERKEIPGLVETG